MKYIKLFEQVGINDIGLVGGKNASLGEMIQSLGPKGILVPSGFAITSDAYQHYLQASGIKEPITKLLKPLDKRNLQALAHVGHQIRSLIRNAALPIDIQTDIRNAYQAMEKRYGNHCDVAVRSSATAEDLPEASFAGQQETFLNIRGEDDLLLACVNAYASLFTDRAISYRVDHGFDHMSVALSIGVQKMVRSDLASAGVIFTLDTESGFKDVIFITSSYGLGENVVKGSVNPDEFYVHKPTLEKGFAPLLKKRIGAKNKKMVYTNDARTPTENVSVSRTERKRFSLTDQEVLTLAQQALMIEKHYSEKKGAWSPMDIEWAKDGKDGKLYILQARPETVHSQKKHHFLEEYVFKKGSKIDKKILTQGKSVGKKIATGIARIIDSIKSMDQIKQGEILVTDITDPDWEPIMKIAGGIVTNRGGRTCHAAIVSRELGIPAIIGTENATEKIKNGQEVTLDCSSGEVGAVYEGTLDFEINRFDVSGIKEPPVNIMINLGNPDEAFNVASLPVKGVGLARLEFIINTSIQVHPMALVHFEKVTDPKERAAIEDLTIGYSNKKQFFIDKVAQEAGTIAAAFYPRPVIIRLSDFKSNEYRKLLSGDLFEPEEENPMLGFRGASRYYHPGYQEAFALECAAMKKIRRDMGLTNIKIMIPFVRTVQEGQRVIQAMKKHGLEQGKDGLEIIMMCEIPSNVLLIDQFCKIFDGFSIGSNDLTQLTLAVDRDSSLVADQFDERNEAVKEMIRQAIQGAHKHGKPIGICGQAPSDFPEIAQLLVDLKIDSMSLNPDSVLKTIMNLGK
ncbi:MAG: phosphoenolpyruvate synthase [bacterium]